MNPLERAVPALVTAVPPLVVPAPLAVAPVSPLTTATPPAAPGPQALEIFCPNCRGKKLGKADRGWLFVRHRGRQIVSRLPASVECEDCHRAVYVPVTM